MCGSLCPQIEIHSLSTQPSEVQGTGLLRRAIRNRSEKQTHRVYQRLVYKTNRSPPTSIGPVQDQYMTGLLNGFQSNTNTFGDCRTDSYLQISTKKRLLHTCNDDTPYRQFLFVVALIQNLLRTYLELCNHVPRCFLLRTTPTACYERHGL